MFLAKSGIYEPCGMFNYKHAFLFIVTLILVFIAIKCTNIKEKNNIKKLIRIITLVLWILEIFKIIFNFVVENDQNLNRTIPLYYCSLLLYAGIFSSMGKGKLQKIGDVFLATGAIVGGIVFLIFPTTSLPEYPMLHFISIHSYVFHGIMIYISIVINKTKYVDLKLSDIKFYAFLVFIICILAYICNIKYGTNLMFISRDFPGTPLETIYKYTGKYFTIVMIILQMTLPFLIVYEILELFNKIKEKVHS